MRVWKTWIWPILKGLAVLIVVVSLVKIAFFPDRPADDGAVPTGQLAEPTISPEIGTVTNDLTITATVREDDPQQGKSPMSGEIVDVFVQEGAAVVYGETIASIRFEEPAEPVMAPDGSVTQPEPEVTWGEVTAPATGTLTTLSVIASQQVAAGEVVAAVTPSALLVGGTIPPVQLYRLTEQPSEGEVTIQDGPAPFTCTDLRISSGTAAGGSQGGDEAGLPGGSGGGSSEARVTCRVPDGVEVFPGLEASLVVHGGVASDVLTLPVTAVTGASGSGIVTVVLPDGSHEEREVGLGLSDGTLVEIVSGLDEGDVVLEFVPGAPAPGDCWYDEMTGAEICDDGSGVVW